MKRCRHEHDIFLGKTKLPVEGFFCITHIIMRQQNSLRTSSCAGGAKNNRDILSVFSMYTPLFRKWPIRSKNFPKQSYIALSLFHTVDQHDIL